MRGGIFDEQEVRRPERSRPTRDTELTLGSGTLLAIFVGLVLLCGLFFGMGYSFGHRGSSASSTTSPQPAPDQEPLQGSGSIPKPSAIAQTPVTPPPAAAPDQAATSAGTATQGQPHNAQPQNQPVQAAPATRSGYQAENQPQVHPALTQGTVAGSSAPAQSVHPAMQQQFEVQIAAVSNPEDAQVLVSALRNRNYPVTARREPSDNYIHVRIGPFASRTIADQWRSKLLSDGYNAVIQP